MKTRFPAYRRVHDWNKVARSMQFDHALFPVEIPTPIEGDLLANLQIPGVLKNKFQQHSIIRLGQLRGMTPEEFLSWRGFGSACMQALCKMLESAKGGKIANILTQPVDYDPALFPVVIPTEIEDEILAHLHIPGILKNRFDQHSLTCLGQLRGMTPENFLGWEGFGSSCMQVLCSLLASAKTGKIAHSLSARLEALSRISLMPDILSFPFQKLNINTLLKSRLRHEFEIQTVADFLDTFEVGKLSRPGWGTRTFERVWEEIATLDTLGAEKYLFEESLDTRSFLEIIHLIRQRLPSRELVIFDRRFFPTGTQFVTLEVVGNLLHLTRERVRQIEKALVKKFQSGKHREIGWLIRRRTLELFKEGVQEMGFEELLLDRFFSGVPASNDMGSAAFVFLDRVLYSTFTVNDDKVVVRKHVKRVGITKPESVARPVQ